MAAATGTLAAAEAPLGPADPVIAGATLELVDSSRLGCGQGMPMWTVSTGGTQCAFDTATRGSRITARQDIGSGGSMEAYATVVRATAGALTPDQLLAPPERRVAEATDLFMIGLKGSAFDGRLKVTSEFARTNRVVDELISRHWALAEQTRDGGTSATIRLDARLISSPRLNWSLSGEYRSVSDEYSVGRADGLAGYFAMPGTRLALSSKGRVGQLGLTAGLEQQRTAYGTSATRKAGLDFHGVSVRLVARGARIAQVEGSTLLEGRSRSDTIYLDLDSHMLAASVLPNLGELPFILPATVSLSFRSGESESRYAAATERHRRTSLGIDGTWETPVGETMIGYWRDERIGLTADSSSRSNEMMQVAHSVRRGNWRFGLDASLARSRGDGAKGYDDRSWSFGQSVAYSAPNGPEFRLHLGQDSGAMRMADDSYGSSDSYSAVTASLDLSRYLQKRYERDDLRLTLDYRRAVERNDSEVSLDEHLLERWVDGYRREGLLMSFGMKL